MAFILFYFLLQQALWVPQYSSPTIVTQAHRLFSVVEEHVITEPATVYPCIPKSSCVQQ